MCNAKMVLGTSRVGLGTSLQHFCDSEARAAAEVELR